MTLKCVFFKIRLIFGCSGHHCCGWGSSSCGQWGLLFTAELRLLFLQSAGSRVQRLLQLQHWGSGAEVHGLQSAGSVGLPWRLSGKEFASNTEDAGLSPKSGRSPGGRNGNPLQHSCLGNPMNKGAWWATVPGVTKSQTQLSD